MNEAWSNVAYIVSWIIVIGATVYSFKKLKSFDMTEKYWVAFSQKHNLTYKKWVISPGFPQDGVIKGEYQNASVQIYPAMRFTHFLTKFVVKFSNPVNMNVWICKKNHNDVKSSSCNINNRLFNSKYVVISGSDEKFDALFDSEMIISFCKVDWLNMKLNRNTLHAHIEGLSEDLDAPWENIKLLINKISSTSSKQACARRRERERECDVEDMER